jgi:phosphatidylinositol 4-kinase
LQVRAESTLLSDVALALDQVKHIGRESVKSRKSLAPKYELLVLLLSNEQTRLNVWLEPLDQDKRIENVVHSAATEVSSNVITYIL